MMLSIHVYKAVLFPQIVSRSIIVPILIRQLLADILYSGDYADEKNEATSLSRYGCFTMRYFQALLSKS